MNVVRQMPAGKWEPGLAPLFLRPFGFWLLFLPPPEIRFENRVPRARRQVGRGSS